MFRRNQRVFIPVDDQNRTADLLAVLLVVEGFLQDGAGAVAVQILRYLFQRNEGTQQNGAKDRELLREGEGDCASDGPAEDDELPSCELVGEEELEQPGGVGFDVVGSGLALVNAVAAVLHRQNGAFGFGADQSEELESGSDVFAVGVEENYEFFLTALDEEARDVLGTADLFVGIEIAFQTAL